MDDKKEFVENELKNALMKADGSIKDVQYAVGETVGIKYTRNLEGVYIKYKNGASNLINITGDSELSIIYDVAKKLLAD